MAVFETMLLSALAPAAVDLLKNGFGAASRKWFGVSVDDQIRLENSGIERLKALAGLDNPGGTPSQWVIDLRASFRYIGAIVSILLGAYIMITSPLNFETGAQLVSIPFGFIFGERMYLTMTNKPK